MTATTTGMSYQKVHSGMTTAITGSHCENYTLHLQKGDDMSRKIKRTNRHHRLSRSRSGGNPIDGEVCGIPNVKVVDYKKHQSFHHLFQDTHPATIAQELNENWLDPNFVMIAVPREDARKLIKHLSQLVH